MRNKLSILFVFISSLANAQAYFSGDSIIIEEPAFSNASGHQIHIQNADQLNESVYFWDNDGRGSFLSPWCNVIVSRTYFDYDSTATSEWSVELKKVDAIVTASALPGKRIEVKVTGGHEYNIQVTWMGGTKMYYQANGMGYLPSGVLGQFSGTTMAYVPYRIPGAQVVSVRVLAAACTQNVGKIIYLH